MKHKLTQRETLFCFHQASLQAPLTAALQAGYPPSRAGQTAARLLQREAIRGQIREFQSLLSREDWNRLLLNGYYRLAFAPGNEAIYLALSEGELSRGQLEEMDLFSIQKLRRGKDGSLELVFYDRMEALIRLQELLEQQERQDTASDWIAALERSAQALGESDETD